MEHPRINVGCGLNAPEGWLNVDRSPNLVLDRVRPVKVLLRRLGVLSEAHMAAWPRNIVRLDVRKGLPYPDGSFEGVYSSHMLEHLYFDQAQAVLREFRRVLRPGGIVRLALPDATRLARDLLEAVDDPEAGLSFNDGLAAHPLEAPGRAHRLLAPFVGNVHRWQPVPALVIHMLTDAGFVGARTRGYLEGDLLDLVAVESRADSLFVEATR